MNWRRRVLGKVASKLFSVVNLKKWEKSCLTQLKSRRRCRICDLGLTLLLPSQLRWFVCKCELRLFATAIILIANANSAPPAPLRDCEVIVCNCEPLVPRYSSQMRGNSSQIWSWQGGCHIPNVNQSSQLRGLRPAPETSLHSYFLSPKPLWSLSETHPSPWGSKPNMHTSPKISYEIACAIKTPK